MWIFGGKNNQTPSREEQIEQQQRSAQTIQALERGQIPPYIRQRIQSQGSSGYAWTSDLSVSEWLVLKQVGLRPLGMVMGSAVYHIGFSPADYRGTWSSRALPDMENALLDVRQRALQRMKEEAQLMGAHAVVGVQLDTKMPGFESHQTEFLAFGTAVVLEGEPVPSEPLLCTVSALDFVKLLAAGSIPVSVGLGVAVYYQYTSSRDKWRTGSFYNQEVRTFSEAVYEVRHLAMRNLRNQIYQAGGNGVLAHETRFRVYEVQVERGEDDEREDHILEFVSSGTIVSSSAMTQRPRIKTVLSLQDPAQNSLDLLDDFQATE